MPTATGQFYVSNGQIIAPNGQPFVARGINVLEHNQPSVATLQADFPGINFVRLAIYDYPNPSALSAYVNQLTSAGIVVELENHNNGAGNAGGSQGRIFTGQTLTNESNWYASVASAFKNNPSVWFGTNNEPSETDASGHFNPAALSSWQQATYNAIRGTGNNDPILVEMNGGSPASMGQGYTPSVYAAMRNIAWDIHYYGWLSHYSTDQTTVTQTLQGCIAQAQTLKSANGTVPVALGEYGNSTNGQTIDPNGTQVINAVQSVGLNMGVGSAAWAYGVGPGDALVNSNGSLTSYGRQVAAVIAALAAKSPPTPPSPNDTVVTAGSTAAIVDASGNKWTITSGHQVAVNGTVDTRTANVIELAYVNSVVWQENSSHLWWSKTSPSAAWSPPAGTSTSPLPLAASSPDDPVNATAPVTTANNDPAIGNDPYTSIDVTNASVTFGESSSRLTFTGSSNSGVIASGQNQTVSLVDNSQIVVQNQSPTALNVLVTGANSNITINDVMHNINIVLGDQGAYTIAGGATGNRGGVFINTAHSSIFVMGISAKDLMPSVTAVT